LRLLIVAVTLAVAALTAVGFFADRLKGGLVRDARHCSAVMRSSRATARRLLLSLPGPASSGCRR